MMKKTPLVALLTFLCVTTALAADPPVYPLKVIENGRYFVDQKNQPFLLHGDSPWEILWRLKKEETVEYLDRRAAQGFNAVLVNLIPDSLGEGHPMTPNRYGHAPFRNPDDFRTAVPEYFDHAEWFVREAGKRDLLVVMFPCYLGINFTWLDDLKRNGVAGAKAYGEFVAMRFKKYPNHCPGISSRRNSRSSSSLTATASMVQTMIT